MAASAAIEATLLLTSPSSLVRLELGARQPPWLRAHSVSTRASAPLLEAQSSCVSAYACVSSTAPLVRHAIVLVFACPLCHTALAPTRLCLLCHTAARAYIHLFTSTVDLGRSVVGTRPTRPASPTTSSP